MYERMGGSTVTDPDCMVFHSCTTLLIGSVKKGNLGTQSFEVFFRIYH